MQLPLPEQASGQFSLARFVEGRRFRSFVMAAVVLNALVLGVATYAELPPPVLAWCSRLDAFFVVLFVLELLLKLFVLRLRFFTSAWNLFDLTVVVVSLVAAGPFTVLRALRILRTLRLVSAVPAMRRVVEALVRAVPGIGAIVGVMIVVFYVSAVLTTSLYGEEFPAQFGGLGPSAVTLFQLMLFDSWGDTLRLVGETHPMAPIFFIAFTVISAFAVLNLFIAVMVDALRNEHDRLQDKELDQLEAGQHHQRRGLEEVDTTVKQLERKVDVMLEKIEALHAAAVRSQGGQEPR